MGREECEYVESIAGGVGSKEIRNMPTLLVCPHVVMCLSNKHAFVTDSDSDLG